MGGPDRATGRAQLLRSCRRVPGLGLDPVGAEFTADRHFEFAQHASDPWPRILTA
jgi:hypothetical protein